MRPQLAVVKTLAAVATEAKILRDRVKVIKRGGRGRKYQETPNLTISISASQFLVKIDLHEVHLLLLVMTALHEAVRFVDEAGGKLHRHSNIELHAALQF